MVRQLEGKISTRAGWIATDWMIGLMAIKNSSGDRVSPWKTPC